jgi:peptidoglycan/xylan/chitin deacetylase (PgdA/CDA1 family)
MLAMPVRPAAVGVAAAAAAAWSAPALAPVLPAAAAALRVATRSAKHGTVALTFDDGPHPQGTAAVLETLSAAQVRATFFLVGEQVLRAPELAAAIATGGHAIGIHGHRHRNLLRIAPRALADDLDRAADIIGAATGVVPVLHRPPYGIYSWIALSAVRARGWTPVLWTRWGRDWRRRATPASITATVSEGLRASDVLLLHDADDYSAPGSWRATTAAVPRVIEAVAATGLRCEPIATADDVVQPDGW